MSATFNQYKRWARNARKYPAIGDDGAAMTIPTVSKHSIKSKYGAKRTTYNGEKYDSKAEANHAAELDLLKKAVDARFRVFQVFRQVNIPLPGGIIYRADFIVLYYDFHWEIHEVKGFPTPEWKLKEKLFHDRYPGILIKIIE